MKMLRLTYIDDTVKVWRSSAPNRIGIEVRHPVRNLIGEQQGNVAATFLGRQDAIRLRDWLDKWLAMNPSRED